MLDTYRIAELEKRIEGAIKLLKLPEPMAHDDGLYVKSLKAVVKDAIRCLKGEMVRTK